MTILETPEIPVEEYHLPQYAYLLDHDFGTEERNRAIRNHIVYGIEFDYDILISDRTRRIIKHLREEEELRAAAKRTKASAT